MKTSTKFWLIILGLSFIALQFNKFFRDFELVILELIIILYFFCIVTLFQCFVKYNTKDLEVYKLNIFYWVLYLPLIKFNNWLDIKNI